MSAPLLLLPLDDRPINLEYPQLLAAVAGESLLLPPREALGHFLTPGNPAALTDWLMQAAPSARALIVSLDMLAYGGLVASRNPLVPEDEALRRLETLREVKVRCPGLHILAFNVIMRLTITGVDVETRAAWRDIFRYSVLRDQAERLGDTAAAVELEQVIARIPPRLLQAYLEARARNHAVNRAALELLGDGVLDFLALVQEDTAPTGLHLAEQASLQALARERVAGDRWRLYPGTDEAALTLLARYLVQEMRVPFPVAIQLRDAEAAQHPALFEDLPLVEAVRRHLDVVGGVEDATGQPFAVHTFTPPQPDLFEMPPLEIPTWDVALRTFPANDVAQWLALWGTLLPGVADTAYCNGGDPHLLDALLADGRYWSLDAYAGWNTAGNTLGTAFAHAALRACARARGITPKMATAHERALLVRLLDDGLYQSVVRAWAMRRTEESGLSPLNLQTEAAMVNEWVNDALQAVWRELCERYPAMPSHAMEFRAHLPWERLFEVRIVFPHDEG